MHQKYVITIGWMLACALILCDQAYAAETTVAGVVVNEAGDPVPGATFYVLQMDPSMVGWRFGLLAETQVGEDGRFAVREDLASGLTVLCLFVATHPNHGITWLMNQGRSDDPANMRLVMPERGHIRGTVKDPAGQPISGAVVTVLITLTKSDIPEQHRLFPPCEQVLKAESQEDGTFSLDGLPKEASLMVCTRASGYAVSGAGIPEETRDLPSGTIEVGAEDVEIVLEPEAIVEGSVLMEGSRTPVEGAEVRFTASKGRSFLGMLTMQPPIKTDASGAFRMPGLGAGSYAISVHHADGIAAPIQLEVAAGSHTTGQEIVLGKGTLVVGKLVFEETGEPVEGAMLYAYRPGGEGGIMPQRIELEADGTFRFREAPGMVYLTAQAPAMGHIQKQITIEEGQETVEVVLEAKEPATFAGTVTMPDDTPLAGAIVTNKHGGGTSATTGEDGTFRLFMPHQRFGQYESALLVASHPDHPTLRGVLSKQLLSEEDATGTIVMNGTATLRGRVVDEESNPIPSAEVASWLRFENRASVDERTQGNTEGAYEFKDAASGATYYIQASAEGYGQDQTENVTPEAGQELDLPLLTLAVADQVLEGTLLDEEGEPAENASISCNGPKTGHRNAQTDEKGHFRFERLVDEELRISAYQQTSEGSLNANGSFMAGETDVELVLQQQARVIDAEEEAARLLVEKQAPELKVAEWISGEAASLESLRGKVVVLAFWSTEDKQKDELLTALQGVGEARGEQVAVIAIHRAGADSAAVSTAASGLTAGRIAIDQAEGETPGASLMQYKVKKTPAVFIVNSKGIVQYQDLPIEAISPAVAGLLGGQ